jgi:chromosome segregation ATPase
MSNGVKSKTDTAKTLIQLVIAFLVLGGMVWSAITFLTPRAVFDEACAVDKARQEWNEKVQNKMREIQQLERAMSRLERKLLQYTLEWQGNSTWLMNLEENWPDESAMSTDLKRQRKKIVKRQEKIERKRARYEDELEEMEKQMDKLELRMEQLKREGPNNGGS